MHRLCIAVLLLTAAHAQGADPQRQFLSPYFVCNGEREHGCEVQFGWSRDRDIFVACYQGGRAEIAAGLCGPDRYGIVPVHTRGGGRCGYDYYRVVCR